MVEVYYYLKADMVEDAIECGMKLSKWFDKEVIINGDKKNCITALLNPKDDLIKFRSEEYKCVKFELYPNYCFIADSYLYSGGENNEKIKDLYTNSIVPIEKYIFGTFRLPECLVTSTIIAGQIRLVDKRLDSPILFDSSEELYINNIIEENREKIPDFNDVMLYYFYNQLAESEKMIKIEENEKNIAFFIDNTGGKTVVLKKPISMVEA